MEKRLLIIDGHALMHRAWHALPPLTAKDGQVVSGAYGFIMILLKAIKELKPTFIAVTFDLAGPTFRHKEYEAYKAKREKKPDELYEQFPIAEEILKAMNIPVYTSNGFEADDVIGTIAKKVTDKTKDTEVVIVTGDKDTLQLVDDRTKVYTLRKGMTDTVLYDRESVIEKMGVKPEQLVDYKALRGDPSDNIPGVYGIGDKTAVDLLKKYGSLEQLYKALNAGTTDDMKVSLQQKLKQGQTDAFMSQNLCKIRRDIELDFNLTDTIYRPVNQEMVREIFEHYQFNRLLAQLPKVDSTEGKRASGQLGFLRDGDVSPTSAESSQIQTKGAVALSIITDIKTAREVLIKISTAKKVAFRTITDGERRPDSIIKYLAFFDGTKVEVFAGSILPKIRLELQNFFSSEHRELVCYNLKKEIGVFAELDLAIRGQFFDLMLASYLLHAGERRHSLDSILSFQRNILPPEKGIDDITKVNRLVTEVTNFLSLADEFLFQLSEQQLEKIFIEIEIPLAFVLSHLERNGFKLDTGYLRELSEDIGRRIEKLTGQIYDLAGTKFNIDSPGQLKEILFGQLGISAVGLKKTEKGRTLSTAASELEKIHDEHKIIPLILNYRELAKLKSTYVDALPPLVNQQTGRLYADFNQTVTATGRLSSSNPNLQNIPTTETEYGRKVRNAFVAERGYILLAADYSQIELRIAAHIAQEKTMIQSFLRGEDIHWRTAAEMFGEDKAKENRRIAKAINFGILYGMGPQRLAINANISLQEAKEYIDTYFALHTRIDEYIQATKEKVVKDGYVETIFGRKRFFPNFHLLNQRERAEAERQAVNMPIQGTSADIIKKAMIRLDQQLDERFGPTGKIGARMILQVHDELVFEVEQKIIDDVIPIIKENMEEVVKLSVPIIVDIKLGENWGSMKGLN
jgi:DNA polymerase-1